MSFNPCGIIISRPFRFYWLLLPYMTSCFCCGGESLCRLSVVCLKGNEINNTTFNFFLVEKLSLQVICFNAKGSVVVWNILKHFTQHSVNRETEQLSTPRSNRTTALHYGASSTTSHTVLQCLFNAMLINGTLQNGSFTHTHTHTFSFYGMLLGSRKLIATGRN